MKNKIKFALFKIQIFATHFIATISQAKYGFLEVSP